MASNIKGITIKIDGNATGLDKALQDVNKKTKSLNSELRQIDKALKLDPKNVTLLKQKFDVLTEQVDATRTKLKSLEDVQDQIKEQYEKGEIDGGQYRAFQRELESTRSKLESLEEAQAEASDEFTRADLSSQYEDLQNEITATQDHLADLQAQASEGLETGDLGEEDYASLQNEIANTENELADLESQAGDVESQLSSLGGEASSAGDDLSNLGSDAQDASQDIGDSFNTSAINFSAVSTSISQVTGFISSAIEKAKQFGREVAGVIKGFYDEVDEINTNATKYDISTDIYQQWKYAEEIVDVSAETMGASLGKLTRKIGQVQDGSAGATEAFDRLGVSVYDSNGNLRDSEDVFYDVIDALGAVEDETEGNILANDVFGRSFQELNPLIDKGADYLKRLGQEAEDRGVIMTPEELATMQDAKDALDKVERQLATALAPIIEKISPYIEDIANWIAQKLADPHTQEVLEKIGEAMGTILEAVTDVIKEMADSGQLEELIDVIVDFLPILADFIRDNLPRMLDGLEQILGFITGLVKPTEDYTQAMKDGAEASDVFSSDGQKNAVALKAGMETNFGIIGNLIGGTFQQGGKDRDGFFSPFTGLWNALTTGADRSTEDVANDIKTNFEQAGINADSSFFDVVMGAFNSLPTDMTTALSSLPSLVGGIFNDADGKITFFDDVKKDFENIPSKIGTWLSGMGSAISRAFSNLKLPKPHLKGFDLSKFPPNLGHIEWYKEGGIFNSPTVIGVGEAGREAVLPIDRLSDIMANALKTANNGYGSVVVNAPVQVIKELNDGEIERVGGRLTQIVGREFARQTGGRL